jgi:hypothetical protein
MKSVRKRLTYANVMSSIAVFLVVAGGTAFAASQLGKESVGTRQLKKEAVSLAKINAAAKSSLKGANGPAGEKGATGAEGPKGATGTQGPKGDKGETGPSTGPAGGALTGNYPNPSLSTATRGVALAAATSPGSGANPAVDVWFNRLGGIPTVTHTSIGNYTVTFPGLSGNVTTNAIVAGNGPNDDQVSVTSSGGSFLVTVLTGAGAPEDAFFSLVVYGGSSAG